MLTAFLIVLLMIWLCLTAILLLNLFFIRKPDRPKADWLRGPLPLVSICVPARNEAQSLAETLPCFLAQDYPNFEVIVVDDCSEDGTAQILSRFAAHPRLKTVQGVPPPRDVVGKCFALEQARQQAQGQYLCFADADIRFEPQALSCAMNVMLERDVDMLVFLPKKILKTFAERLLMPGLAYAGFWTRPLFRVNWDKSLRMGLGSGAFNLVKRSAYEAAGGHRKLLKEVMDDLKLGQIILRVGCRQRLFDGRDLISVRMYSGLKEIWRGYMKNLGWLAKGSWSIGALVTFSAIVIEIVPFLLPLLLLADRSLTHAILIGSTLGLNLFSGYQVGRIMEAGPAFMLLRPASTAIWLAMFWRSFFLLRNGKLQWRGRPLTVAPRGSSYGASVSG
jgi:chlorobactene glucosyltransferase